jgi:site-specific DNA recombinase
MNVAIYARKSTEQIVSAEQKSVTRQIDNAKTFAAKRGWTVDPSHIFNDDGISGGEFERRPGLQAMLKAAESRQFSALIVSERKSIGRESVETAHLVKRLAKAGVEVWEYVHGKSLTPRNAMEKLLSTVQGFSDEDHREKTAERVHEAHLRLATAGRVTGGRVFGYRNVHRFNGEDASGNPLKSHTERVIDPAEAKVVRRIFELYASGVGLKSIAKQLTSEQAAVPTPFIRRDISKVQPLRAWAPSSVRSILCRDLYRGIVTWNKTKKRDDWGSVRQHARPKTEWQSIEAPSLRIVSDELWNRVASRRADTADRTVRFKNGRISGRPPKSGVTHLLAGLATCAECGGGLIVETSPRKRGRVPEYQCYRHRANGTCTNGVCMPVSTMDEAVLRAVEEVALTAATVESVIELSERDDQEERRKSLTRDRADVEKKIGRLVQAVENGGDVVSLTARLRQLETERAKIDEELANAAPIPRLPKPVIEDRLAEWRRLLRQSTTQARAVIQRLVKGRITFTPVGDCYEFDAETRIDKLFSGVVLNPAVWSRKAGRGTSTITRADVEGPQPAVDADYAAVLARALTRIEHRRIDPAGTGAKRVKGVTSPTGAEHFHIRKRGTTDPTRDRTRLSGLVDRRAS